MITKEDLPIAFTCSWTGIVIDDEGVKNEIESSAAHTTAPYTNLRKPRVSWN